MTRVPAGRFSTLQAWSGQGYGFRVYANATGRSVPLPAHSHEEYQLIFSVHAAERYRCRGASWLVPAGSFVLFHPEEVHAAEGEPWETGRAVEFRSLLLSPSLLADPEGRSGAGPRFPEPVGCDETLRHRLRGLERSLRLGPPGGALETDERLLGLLARLVRRHACRPADWLPREPRRSWPATAPGRRRTRAVERVRALLRADPAADHSLAALARAAGLSASHLCALFRREVGLPVTTYLIQLRVERARRLLDAGLPIAEAAVRSGFADQSHLHRYFRRLLGVSPGRYRGAPAAGRRGPGTTR